MKILTHKDIVDLNIDPIECYNWVSEMIKNKNTAILPAKISMKPSKDVFYNIMPSILPTDNIGGVKVVSRHPSRNPALDSQVMLYDTSNGDIKGILDANYITTMRTGAVAAHSIKLLAKEGFTKVGIIGLGNQARATIKVLLAIFPNKEITLKLMEYKDQHLLFQEFVKELTTSKNIKFEICNSYRETVKGSDVIISSVTYFDEDICDNDCFDEGCLLVPIHTRGFMNCDLFFDKVFGDDTHHVEGFKYFNEFKQFAEISDVCRGIAKGRENNSERILVYNIGLSIHDMYFSEKIYELAELRNKGLEISLDSPKEKFWI
jgi:ornithine cyclodeaminase/alanine dehydrogenase-like protein (mu-crystallin family)